MRPDISFYNKQVDIEEDLEEDAMEEEAAEQAKSKSRVLTEVRVEYSKRRADENHFGPLTFTEVDSARNEEPWLVSDYILFYHMNRRKKCMVKHTCLLIVN